MQVTFITILSNTIPLYLAEVKPCLPLSVLSLPPSFLGDPELPTAGPAVRGQVVEKRSGPLIEGS